MKSGLVYSALVLLALTQLAAAQVLPVAQAPLYP
jgi:hypothetical protein